MTASEPTVAMLWDLEQIKQLKARYFRFIDTKDWESFRDLFTPDCKHWLPADSPKPYATNEEYLQQVPEQLANGVTTHHGHMPEIELTGPTTAIGIWALHDVCTAKGEIVFDGAGYYRDEYVKQDGRWRIRYTGYRRVLEQHWSNKDLPSAKIDVG